MKPGPPIAERRATQYGMSGVTHYDHMGDAMHGGDGETNLHLHGSTAEHLTRPGGPYGESTRVGRVRTFFADMQESCVATKYKEPNANDYARND